MTEVRNLGKKIKLRCPKCTWLFEAENPDNLHPHGSVTRPKDSEVDGDIIEEIYDCRNPKCRNPTKVYWYWAKPAFKLV